MNGHWLAATVMGAFVTACGSSGDTPRVGSAAPSVVTVVTSSVSTSQSTVTTSSTKATSHSESSTEIEVNGGRVSASVVNGTVTVFDVEAADGWTVDRDDSEAGVITLRFSRGGDVSEVRLQLTANGQLQQSTVSRSGGGAQSTGG